MIRCAWMYLRHSPSRSLLIITSVGLCTVLMAFLISVYRGVSDGTLEYVRQNQCDLWVLQQGTTNIVRGSSLLLASQGRRLETIENICSISPILLSLSVVQTADRDGTVYLIGYEPDLPRGGPPRLWLGRMLSKDNEIVLDRCFAEKFAVTVGDTVAINRVPLEVVGISDGTNAFVIQYAFTTLITAQRLMGGVRVVGAYLVTVHDPDSLESTAMLIEKIVPNVSVYTREQFITNNRREMQAGFLPFIIAVCIISVGVLIIILGLLLSLMILERRVDFAVMKAIGAPSVYLPGLVLNLAGLVAIGGVTLGLLLYFPVTALVRLIAPELNTIITATEIGQVGLCVTLASLISAMMPLRRLRSIYPAEVFQ